MKAAVASAACMAAVLAVAAWLRLADLDNRPMHCDEAVQAVKFGLLLTTHEYVYDKFEYHGPSLCCFTLPVAWLASFDTLADASEIELRLVPAVFGILLVGLVWLVRDELGHTAAVAAAVLTAVSPAMVFYSRYYVQEMILVSATFGAIVALWRFARPGRAIWLVLLGVSVGIMHASKETCVIALFAMALAAICQNSRRTLCAVRFFFSQLAGRGRPKAEHACYVADGTRSVPATMAGIAVAAAVAAAVSGLLFSNFFKTPGGVVDSYTAFFEYLNRAAGEGSVGRHDHPWYYYFRILFWWPRGEGPLWTEAAVAVLALVGVTAGVLGRGIDRARLPAVRFLTIYTLVLTAAYTAIPYKTPWCALGFLHGMILLAGVGAAVLLRAAPGYGLKGFTAVLLVAAAAQLGWQSYRAAFTECERPSNPYTYAQPTEDILAFVAQIEQLAESDPQGRAMPIQVICPDGDYWPLPWYLRRFSQVGWLSEMPEGPPAPVIVTQPPLVGALAKYLYQDQPPGRRDLYMPLEPRPKEGRWLLRPHVPLELYLRRDVWEKCHDGQRPHR
jgi:uncharacterized protein (TIGR03663 family)